MAMIEKCQATDCIYNEDEKCCADNLWIGDNGKCEGYEVEKDDPVTILTSLLPLTEEEADSLDEGRRRRE